MRLSSICFSLLFLSGLAFSNQASAEHKIGVILPLSGPLAEYGTAELHGIEMAQADNPKLFSKLKFIFEDSQYDPKTALTAYNKLRSQDAVSLIYDWGAATGLALAPVAESQKFPLISMSIDPSAARGKSYVIRFGNYAEQYIQKIVPYLRSRNFKTVGIVKVELAYTNSMADELERQFSSTGEQVKLLGSVNPGDTDFKTIVARLKQVPVDVLAVYLMGGQIRQFYRQLSEQGVKLPTIGTDFFESTDEIAAAGGAMEGAVYPHNPVPESFHQKYQAKYGNDSQIAYAVNGYDFAALVGRVLGGMEELPQGQAMIKAFAEVPPQAGLVGDYLFRSNAGGGMFFDFPIALKVIKENRVVEIR